MTISLAQITQNACLNINCSPHFSNYSFGPTRTPSPWEGIRKSDKFSAVCPQRLPDVINEQEALKKMPKGRLEYIKRLLPFLQNQSEDCLYLNVFSPLHGKPKAPFTLIFSIFPSPMHILFPISFLSCSGCSREETSRACFHSWRVVRMEFGKSLRWFGAG